LPSHPETPCRQSNARLLYSRKEAAYQLSISTRAIDYLIATREIAVRRNGSRILIPHAELVRYARADHYQPIRPQSAQAVQQEQEAHPEPVAA
jgi:excisionase family DNA binding protein